MSRIIMVALASVLAFGACSGPFGPNNTVLDPKSGLWVEMPSPDSLVRATNATTQSQQTVDDDN